MRRLSALGLLLVLSACASVSSVGVAEPAPAAPGMGVAEPAVAPGMGGMFPECQGVELAFSGETSLAELGLGEAAGPDANKVGMIWVTAGLVMFEPMPAGGKGEEQLGEQLGQRMVCVQWPDGSGMAGPVDDAWQPPSLLDGGDGEGIGAEGPPLGLLALLVGAVVLVGASVFAFRGEA
jgi:hypothetical protein